MTNHLNSLPSLTQVSALISPILIAIIAGVFALYKLEKSKRHSLENQLNDKKFAIYDQYINDYTSIFFKKNGKSISDEQLMDIVHRVQQFNKTSMLYASDKVLKKYVELYKLQIKSVTDPANKIDSIQNQIDALANLIVAMREELGHKSTRVNIDDIGTLLITDYVPKKKRWTLCRNRTARHVAM